MTAADTFRGDPPFAMRRLDMNKAGYLVPWFVDREADGPDGQPDFRVMNGEKLHDAWRFSLCWVCGQRRGVWGTFVVGPMCGVNRTSAEPPSHHACALYSATVCPFLTRPTMVRRTTGTEDRVRGAGVMLDRNPGVTLLWTTKRASTYQVRARPGVEPGMLFDMGEAHSATMEWYAHGRTATAAEVMAAIDSGLPVLRKMTDDEGAFATLELGRRVLSLTQRIITELGTAEPAHDHNVLDGLAAAERIIKGGTDAEHVES